MSRVWVRNQGRWLFGGRCRPEWSLEASFGREW